MLVQILDCDYMNVNSRPVTRLFCKDEKGESVCVFYEGHYPYFYATGSDYPKIAEFLRCNFGAVLLGAEIVERRIPAGYTTEKTKMMKITLKDPSKTPAVREGLKGLPYVHMIFEADILYKYRFMNDYGIGGMQWIEVSGGSAPTGTVKTKRTVIADSIKHVDKAGNCPMKIAAFDLEVECEMGGGMPEPEKDPIIMVSIAFSEPFMYKGAEYKDMVITSKPVPGEGIISRDSEEKMLETFNEAIRLFDPDIMTGYNVNNFDFPFLIGRMRHLGVDTKFGRCNRKGAYSMKFGDSCRNTVPGRIAFDVYSTVRREGNVNPAMRLKRYGLGDVSKKFLGEDKTDVPHSKIKTYWNGSREEISMLAEYCRKDSDLALRIFTTKNLADKYIEVSKVSGVLLQDILDGGESIRADNMLLKELNDRGYVLFSKPGDRENSERNIEREEHGVKGGFVLDPVPGFYSKKPIIVLDFKGMYPSIIRTFNICPTTVVKDMNGMDENNLIKSPTGAYFVKESVQEGVIPHILTKLVNGRDAVKKELKKEEDEERIKQLNAKQMGLKIMANAFYGYTGYVRARLYDIDVANAITSYGRSLIHMTKETTENKYKLKIIYGDTDSVMVQSSSTDLEESFRIGTQIGKEMTENMEGHLELEFKKIFYPFLILTKKRYAAISLVRKGGVWKDKMDMKGIETVRRDWCDLVSESLSETLRLLLTTKESKESVKYIKEIIESLVSGNIDIDKLVITKSVTRKAENYDGIQPHVEAMKKMQKRNIADAPSVGDRIGYVIVKGMGLLSKRAEDPEYVKQNKIKIDSDYYLNNQLMPPLRRIFNVLEVSESELMGRGRQVSLFEAMSNGNGKVAEKEEEKDLTLLGFICPNCRKDFRRPPLIGLCDCGSEIKFATESGISDKAEPVA